MNTRTDNRTLIRHTHNCTASGPANKAEPSSKCIVSAHRIPHLRRCQKLQCTLLPCLWLFFLILTLGAYPPCAVYAEDEPVTARFISSSGEKLAVELKVAKPVPGSVIFTLNLPEKVQLVKSDPPAGKYDKSKGQVKWLLRGLSPGNHKITLNFSKAVQADSLQAEVRYLNSANGKLCILPVKK